MDGVPGSKEETAFSKTEDSILHFLEQVFRHGHETPHSLAHVFPEEAMKRASLRGRETLLPDVPQENARQLGAAPCGRSESRLPADESPDPFGIRLVQVALRDVGRVQIPTQERSSSRKRALSL